MAITITDFDEIGYTYSSAQEIVVQLRNGNWFGEYSHYYGHFDGLDQYVVLANRLCGKVFILTGRGEGESVRLRQSFPDCHFIYPLLHRPNDFAEFPSGVMPNRYEKDVRRQAPFVMCIAYASDEFRKVMGPYLLDDERRFIMNDDIFMLMSMCF